MSSSYYAKALKAGQKEFRQARHRGLYPYLPALDELISRADIVSEVNLGLVHIPLSVSSGRRDPLSHHGLRIHEPFLRAGGKQKSQRTEVFPGRQHSRNGDPADSPPDRKPGK